MKNKLPGGKKTVAGACVALMLAIAVPFIGGWEGRSLSPYRDIVGVWTVCDGETRVAMRRYTAAECDAMSEKAVAEFATKVAKLSPGIEQYPYQWAAHTSLAYNVGIGSYQKSSVRRLFNAGEYRAACRFMRRYKFAGGRVVKGLRFRREGDGKRIGEYEICLADAVEAELARGSDA